MRNVSISIKKLIKCPNRIAIILKYGGIVQIKGNWKLILKIVPSAMEGKRTSSILDILDRMPGVHHGKGKMWLPEPVKLIGDGPTASDMILEDRR